MSPVKKADAPSEPKAKTQPKETKVSKGTSVDVMTLKPRMSEKSYDLSHSMDTYVFDVPTGTNKIEVAKAVSRRFKVSVEGVRIVIMKGKKARSIRIGGTRKNVSGKRPDVKKAYVKIKNGETIPIFASIDEAEEKAKKAEEKAAKKAGKTVEKPEEKPKRRGLLGFRKPKGSK
jgi:ribosomal protein L23